MAPAPRARAIGAIGVALLLGLGACTFDGGSRSSSSGSDSDGLIYRVRIDQTRRGEGIGKTPDRNVSINSKLIERSFAGGMSIVVDDIDAEGEASQVAAAHRLRGKAIAVRIGPQGIEGISLGLSEDPDLSAADIALLFQVVSPSCRARGAPRCRDRSPG